MFVTRTLAITNGWTQLSVRLTAANFEGSTNQLKGPAYLRNPAASGQTLRVAGGYTAAPPGANDGVPVAPGETLPIDSNVKFNAAKIWVKAGAAIDVEFALGTVGTQVIVAPA